MALPPVLLLHGWGGSFASTFAAHGWLDALAHAGRLSLPMDLPGHGDSPASRDPQDYFDLAGLVADRLPPGPIDVIGYSLGAKLALALAGRRGANVRRIVAIGVGDNLFAPEASGAAVADALEHGHGEDEAPGIRALVEYSRASGSDPLALAAVLRRAPNPLVDRAALAALGPRTLLMNGLDDTLALPDQELRTALGDLTYIQLAGIGHVQMPSYEAVRQAAIAFLSAVDERDAPTSPPMTMSL